MCKRFLNFIENNGLVIFNKNGEKVDIEDLYLALQEHDIID